MSFTPSGSNEEREQCPAGQHVGRLFRLIDEGTQIGEWEGQPTKNHKAYLGFEIFPTDEAGELKLMKDGKPFGASLELNVTFGKKAKMTNLLEAWRGKPYAAGEIPDLSERLGKWGLISIIHAPGKNGKEYVNIGSIVPVPAVMTKTLPKPVNELSVFDLDMPDWVVYEALWGWLKEKIAKSPEFAKAKEDAPAF